MYCFSRHKVTQAGPQLSSNVRRQRWSDSMWPFSRRQTDLSAVPPISSEAHIWSVAKATYDESPLIVRFNSGAKEWVGHKALPIKLGFAVPLNAPNDGGV